MRILLYSPKDMVAGLLAFAAVTAIITNALFLQAGPHPSPMFGSVVVMPAPAPYRRRPHRLPRPSARYRQPVAAAAADGGFAAGATARRAEIFGGETRSKAEARALDVRPPR